MAFPGGGIGTHYDNAPGGSIVEDVTDVIFQITPEDTPFFEISGEARGIAITHEWQERSLTTRQDNAKPEGFSYDFTLSQTLPSRVSNIMQIIGKEIRVSASHQAVSHYAITDLFADQMQQRMTELKTDVEHTLIRGTLASGNATDASRRMYGFLQAISNFASTTYTDYTATVTLTETLLNQWIETSWGVGGEPRDAIMHGRLKRNVSSFSAEGTRFVPHDSGRVVNTISFYESDFFPVQLHLSRDMPTSASSGHDLVLVDRTMLRKAFLRPFVAEMVPKTADSVDGAITTELTLEWGNADAHFYARNVVPTSE